jgi:hypothetical protein
MFLVLGCVWLWMTKNDFVKLILVESKVICLSLYVLVCVFGLVMTKIDFE